MQKTKGRKTYIRIWDSRMINSLENRSIRDRDITILQIEPGAGDMSYIVEYVRNDESPY